MKRLHSSDPNTSIPDEDLKVKQLTGGTPLKRQFSIQLQGEVLLAMEQRARKLGLSANQYFRYVLEMDLVKEGELPDWWYTRKR